jgi:hypothetical protein
MLSAVPAVFAEFKFLRRVSLVLPGGVVPVLALGALKK